MGVARSPGPLEGVAARPRRPATSPGPGRAAGTPQGAWSLRGPWGWRTQHGPQQPILPGQRASVPGSALGQQGAPLSGPPVPSASPASPSPGDPPPEKKLPAPALLFKNVLTDFYKERERPINQPPPAEPTGDGAPTRACARPGMATPRLTGRHHPGGARGSRAPRGAHFCLRVPQLSLRLCASPLACASVTAAARAASCAPRPPPRAEVPSPNPGPPHLLLLRGRAGLRNLEAWNPRRSSAPWASGGVTEVTPRAAPGPGGAAARNRR